MAVNGEAEGGGATVLKGLRLVTMDRGPEGFGFHMYTNKTLKVSYPSPLERAQPDLCLDF